MPSTGEISPGPTSARPIVCFGELLWDHLPSGRRPGGAPANVAYHLNRLGHPALVMSAVGRDPAGAELITFLREHGVPVDAVSVLDQAPTDSVTASLDASGNAKYTIHEHVAWDFIPSPALPSIARSRALVFGSLAQRSATNRDTSAGLSETLPSDALRVFDVSLRSESIDWAQLQSLAHRVSILKLNHEEAHRWSGISTPREAAGWLRETTEAEIVCITMGAQGAGALFGSVWFCEPSRPVEVVDTVGAGDAFLAGFLAAHLEGRSPQETLVDACRLGEWVASVEGAMP